MPGRFAAWLKSLVDGIGAAAGAAGGSQLPEFVQQYLQRLGGHRDEAFRFVQQLKAQGAEASSAVVTLAQERADSLARAFDAIAQTDGLLRPAVFLRYADVDVAQATMELFRPAVPLTPAGLLYGGLGLLAGIVLVNLVIFPFRLFRRRARA
jgi:hypothetical protein